MKHDKPKRPHRTQIQMLALQAEIIAAINREDALKSMASAVGCSKSHVYHLAQGMGYQQLLVSASERAVLREMRGVASRFKKTRRAA